MDPLGLDLRPGRVVQAEIFRRFSAPVSFDPSLSPKEFFLVLSVGRCKYRLTEVSVSSILHSVIGGNPHGFRVLSLGDRVFRFSVHSQEVGFHIYRLKSYECASFKVFFHLWHGGGPNFRLEYKLWLQEQASEWTYVVKGTSNSNPLSGANRTRLGQGRVLREHQNSNFQIRNVAVRPKARISAFTRILPAISDALNPAFKGILGPRLLHLSVHSQLRHFGPARQRTINFGPLCQTCGRSGHLSRRCGFPPRSPRLAITPAGNNALSTGISLPSPSPAT